MKDMESNIAIQMMFNDGELTEQTKEWIKEWLPKLETANQTKYTGKDAELLLEARLGWFMVHEYFRFKNLTPGDFRMYRFFNTWYVKVNEIFTHLVPAEIPFVAAHVDSVKRFFTLDGSTYISCVTLKDMIGYLNLEKKDTVPTSSKQKT